MELSNQHYDLGKWLVLIFLPAFAVLMSGLGDLYNWLNASVIVATVNLLAVFLGSVLQLSSKNYHDGNSAGGGGNFVESSS